MIKHYSDIDVYSKDGRLLLAKGQELTEEVVLKLERLSALDQINLPEIHEDGKLVEYICKLKEKIKVADAKLFKDSSGILTDILFDKSHSWWMYINTLSNYVDWIYEHSIDVSLISLMIALKLDYSDIKIKSLCIGGMLHDVGKLMIPKDILQKTGKLSDQEMALVKQHCELGYSMVKNLDFPIESTNIILQHHERLDGSGYPFGLHSDQISDNAKIVMIADVFDAITAYRPYHNSRKVGESIEIMYKDGPKYSKYILDILRNYVIE